MGFEERETVPEICSDVLFNETIVPSGKPEYAG
jgi:hypothetical protein